MFKLIGAILGFLAFNFVGGLIGYFIGGVVDRARAYGFGGVNPLSHGQRQAVFIKTTFVLMGKLAKTDGHISQDEIDHVELFIQKIGMSAEHRTEAITFFRQGAAEDFDVQPQINEFMSICGHTRNLPQILIIYLIVMSLVDGKLDAAEEKFMRETSVQFGFTLGEFQQMLETTLNQFHFSGRQSGAGQRPTSASDLEEAYKALGVTKENTDKEIKRAYRKLISKYHPDKLIGQGVPEDMIAVATEQTKEIQKAYELIEKSRKN